MIQLFSLEGEEQLATEAKAGHDEHGLSTEIKLDKCLLFGGKLRSMWTTTSLKEEVPNAQGHKTRHNTHVKLNARNMQLMTIVL